MLPQIGQGSLTGRVFLSADTAHHLKVRPIVFKTQKYLRCKAKGNKCFVSTDMTPAGHDNYSKGAALI